MVKNICLKSVYFVVNHLIFYIELLILSIYLKATEHHFTKRHSTLLAVRTLPRQQDHRQPLRSALGADGAGGVKQAKEKHRKYSCVSLWPVSE